VKPGQPKVPKGSQQERQKTQKGIKTKNKDKVGKLASGQSVPLLGS